VLCFSLYWPRQEGIKREGKRKRRRKKKAVNWPGLSDSTAISCSRMANRQVR
jgi:hypothetical protein